LTITLKPLHIAIIAFVLGCVVTAGFLFVLLGGFHSNNTLAPQAFTSLAPTSPPIEAPSPTATPPSPTSTPTGDIQLLSITGTGGLVPEGGAGASFDIVVDDPRLIEATGNTVTLTLIGVDTTAKTGAYAGFGGLVDFTVTLEHVGQGDPRYVFDRVLNSDRVICLAGLSGTYVFRSGEPTPIRNKCGTGNTTSQMTQNPVIPPGTYLTTLPDDVTDSNLSSAWNGQPVFGTWRLHLLDRNVNTSAGQFNWNAHWTWQLDVKVSAA
jgi:hypothetical protein